MIMPSEGNLWNAFHALRDMQDRMNRFFGGLPEGSPAVYPPMNAWINESGAIVRLYLPGVDPNELDITTTQDTLTVRGQHRPGQPGEQARWHRRERYTGRFARSVQLPFAIDGEGAEAHYANGVLELKLARPATDRPRKIEVRSA
jgi:HSP20 family protein